MKNLSYLFISLIISSLLLSACQGDSAPELKPLDLMPHGFPISVMVPDSAEVKKSFSGIMDELTILGDGNFGLLIQSYSANSLDVAKIKADELELVKNGKFFSKIMKEDPAGFMYETAVDSTSISYDFFHVKIQGDKEYRFTTPYTGTYTENEITRVYNSLNKK